MRIILKGKVQGVSFRYFVKTQAELLGIKGWVKNRSDGSIEIMASGEHLNEFVSRCKKGPSLAKVEHMETKDVDEENTDFTIKF